MYSSVEHTGFGISENYFFPLVDDTVCFQSKVHVNSLSINGARPFLDGALGRSFLPKQQSLLLSRCVCVHLSETVSIQKDIVHV